MVKHAKLAPPYSQVQVVDTASGSAIPILTGDAPVVASNACIAIACLAEMDGQTSFTLGLTDEVDPGNAPIFSGPIMTPNRKVALRTVEGDVILEIGVENIESNVQVWIGDLSEPDEVIVGVS